MRNKNTKSRVAKRRKVHTRIAGWGINEQQLRGEGNVLALQDHLGHTASKKETSYILLESITF